MSHMIYLLSGMHMNLTYDTMKEVEYDFGYVYFHFFLNGTKVLSINKNYILKISHFKSLFSSEQIIDYNKIIGEG